MCWTYQKCLMHSIAGFVMHHPATRHHPCCEGAAAHVAKALWPTSWWSCCCPLSPLPSRRRGSRCKAPLPTLHWHCLVARPPSPSKHHGLFCGNQKGLTSMSNLWNCMFFGYLFLHIPTWKTLLFFVRQIFWYLDGIPILRSELVITHRSPSLLVHWKFNVMWHKVVPHCEIVCFLESISTYSTWKILFFRSPDIPICKAKLLLTKNVKCSVPICIPSIPIRKSELVLKNL